MRQTETGAPSTKKAGTIDPFSGPLWNLHSGLGVSLDGGGVGFAWRGRVFSAAAAPLTATMCGTCRLLFDGIFWMEDKSRKWLVIAFVVAHLMGGASYCIVDA